MALLITSENKAFEKGLISLVKASNLATIESISDKELFLRDWNQALKELKEYQEGNGKVYSWEEIRNELES